VLAVIEHATHSVVGTSAEVQHVRGDLADPAPIAYDWVQGGTEAGVMFGHEIEAEAKVVACEKLKERIAKAPGGEAAPYQVVETWRFVLDVAVPGGGLTRVQHDEEFRGRRYDRPAPGDTVTVAFKEGHPGKLSFVLENSRFDVINMGKKREEAQKAQDAEAVRSAMERPAGAAPQARPRAGGTGAAAAGGSPGSGTGQSKPARRKMSPQDKLLMEKLRLARDGSPGTATILALGNDGTRTATIRVQPDSGEMFETTIKLLKSHLEVGQSVRVRFNPAHHSKVVLLNTAAVGGLWHVPAHCPDCGAPVDQAVASVAAHPVCAYCHHPIPCDPA
jgi:hypothetical protein